MAGYCQKHAINKPIGHFREFTFSQSSLLVNGENGQLLLTHYSPEVIRIRASQTEISDGISYSVINEAKGEFGFRFNSSVLILTTDSLKIEIDKYPLHLKIFTHRQELITEHYFGLSISWLDDKVTSYHRLFSDEIFLGLGDQPGPLNKRGHYFDNRKEGISTGDSRENASVSFIPFFIGIHDSLMYGIFLDNTSNTSFDFGSASDEQFYSFSADDGHLDYFFIYGSDIPDIIEKYSRLTGTMELPPLWSLGYHHCRNGYSREKEVFRAAESFRENDFPIDLICLDPNVTHDFRSFTWNPDGFSFPSGLTSKLKDLGIHTAIQLDPGIKVLDGYFHYDEGIRKDYFIKYPNGIPYTGQTQAGRSHFPDFTRPETRTWWSEQMRILVSEGITSIWLGFTENSFLDDKTPEIIEFDFEGEKASLKKAKNAYYLLLARSSFYGMKDALDGKRPLILSNNAYAGIQRYAGIWNGDSEAGDQQMLQGVRKMLGLGISGIPLAGNDIGSLLGNPSPELFLRWLNLGVYSPLFFNFSGINTLSQEPWSFGDKATTITRSMMEKRYQLLPYIYSSLYASTSSGMPLCRSLAIEYPFDRKIYNVDFQNEYLFGESILVIPAASEEHIVRAYIPEGEWYTPDIKTMVSGPKEILVEAPADSIPVFYKGGSIIPMQHPILNTSGIGSDTLYLHVFNGSRPGSFDYYEDDGVSYKYMKGNYYKRKIEFNPLDNKITIHKANGNLSSKFATIRLIMHGFDPVKKAEVNLRKYSVEPLGNMQIITFDNYQEDIFILW